MQEHKKRRLKNKILRAMYDSPSFTFSIGTDTFENESMVDIQECVEELDRDNKLKIDDCIYADANMFYVKIKPPHIHGEITK